MKAVLYLSHPKGFRVTFPIQLSDVASVKSLVGATGLDTVHGDRNWCEITNASIVADAAFDKLEKKGLEVYSSFEEFLSASYGFELKLTNNR